MAIALTFDDGPDPVWTPAVLDALAAVDAHATFFVVGPRAERWPDLVRRCVREGHAVGLHCDEHVRHTERDADWLVADCARALARLAAIGIEPRLWRTPWGVMAPHTFTVAADAGLALVGWDVDTHDWRGDDADSMLGAIADGLFDGAVVLAHDALGPGARRDGCEETVALIGSIAERARAGGIALDALPGSVAPA